MTGLPNRNLLGDRLRQAIARAERGGKDCFVLWLDVDRFLPIQAMFGRKPAEATIVEVARWLRGRATGCTTIARVADDEFVRLRAIGVRLAIDDFGVGYSSQTSLGRFPIDCLKIDRSFVHDAVANSADASIAVSIISLAHHLNMRVCAEGVETDRQLRYLHGHGCDEIQGGYFAEPLSAARFEALVLQRRRLDLPRR